jgi:hypothetical protein
MQVSSIDTKVTHAVIGGGEAQSYNINASAEFFEMLSASMYSLKKLAVVREVICNAWDAHIASGRADVPIEITLTKNEMVIADKGPGLSPERIVPIYCVFGNSTKAHDGKQTGGFGIGSKAPFAYTRHFTVTSCHNGEMTIYAASRGSAETKGCPDFRKMVSMPTKDTGLSVSIPMLESEDWKDFEELIKTVVYEGGIHATLNGAQLARIEYERAEQSFILSRHEPCLRSYGDDGGIYVLYGSVMYPVDLSKLSRDVEKSLGFSSHALRKYNHILIAPPNCIGVTPSRESLSYTDATIDSLNKLLRKASKELESMKGDVPAIARQIVYDAIVANATTPEKTLQMASMIHHSLFTHRGLIDAASLRGVMGERNFTSAVTKDAVLKSITHVELIASTAPAEWFDAGDPHIKDRVIRKFYSLQPKIKKELSRIARTYWWRSGRAPYKSNCLSNRAKRAVTGQRHAKVSSWQRMTDTMDRQFGVKLSYVADDGYTARTCSQSAFLSSIDEDNSRLRTYDPRDALVVFCSKISDFLVGGKSGIHKRIAANRQRPAILVRIKQSSDMLGCCEFMMRAGFTTFTDLTELDEVQTPVTRSERPVLLLSANPLVNGALWANEGKYYVRTKPSGSVADPVLCEYETLLLGHFGDCAGVTSNTAEKKMMAAGLKCLKSELVEKINELAARPDLSALVLGLNEKMKSFDFGLVSFAKYYDSNLLNCIPLPTLARIIDPSLKSKEPTADESVALRLITQCKGFNPASADPLEIAILKARSKIEARMKLFLDTSEDMRQNGIFRMFSSTYVSSQLYDTVVKSAYLAAVKEYLRCARNEKAVQGKKRKEKESK